MNAGYRLRRATINNAAEERAADMYEEKTNEEADRSLRDKIVGEKEGTQ